MTFKSVAEIEIFFHKLIYHQKYSWDKYHQCFTNESVGELTVYTTKEDFFGFYLTYLNYLICGLSLKVLHKRKGGSLYQENALILSRQVYEERGILNGMQIPIEEKYMFTIMTTSLTKSDLAYLPFLNLFEPMVWLLVLLFYASYSTLIKLLIHKNLDNFDMVFRSITEKSVHEFESLEHLLRPEPRIRKGFKGDSSLIILSVIWIVFSAIITKGFSSVLLKTYFNPKSCLAVSSVEDIIEDPELSVAGNYSLYFLKAAKPTEYHKLVERVEKYEKKLEKRLGKKIGYQWRTITQDQRVLKEVVRADTVLLLDSYAAEYTLRMNPGFRLVTAEDKYSPNYITFFISEQHFCYHKIILSLMHCIETGIYDHMKTLEIIKEEMMGRVSQISVHDNFNESDKKKVIKLKELLKGVLLIFVSGNLFSIVLFILECLTFHILSPVKGKNRLTKEIVK